MDSAILLSVLGTMASIAGLAIAGVQSIRLRELKRRTNADVWLTIRTTASIIATFEDSASRKTDPNVGEAHAKAVELYRHLMKQAVLDERNFSGRTINRWRSVGKVHTDWQEDQAWHFVPTEAISPVKRVATLPEPERSTDEQ